MDSAQRDEALLGDPAALAEVRSQYRGSIDLADLLRWRLDPSATGSDGSRSPVLRAEELAPIIYGRAETPDALSRRDAAAAEAEALFKGWAADSAALEAAISDRERSRAAADRRVRPRRKAFPLGRLALIAGAVAAATAVLVTLGVVLQRPVAEVAASSTPRPVPTVERPTPTRTAAPPAPVAPPVITQTPVPEVIDYRPDYFEDNINSILQVPINGDPIDNANGVAKVDDYGVPLSYVVANGDVFELIAKRFDLGTDYLAAINAVRRDRPTELFVGDTINLGATTILRIGDQNGVVYDHTDRMPEPHLPQD